MSIRTVGVAGTGVIGSSWTGLFLAHGLRVLVSDPGPSAKDKLANYLKTIWPTLQQIGLSPGASLSNYEFVGANLKGRYSEVDFIQENAPERPELKSKLVGEIDAETRADVIIASSSSGIPCSQFVGQCAKNLGRVLIGHPFNPPHLMPLVEVVPHPKTDETMIEGALQFYRSLGQNPVLIKKEVPGFVANRLQTVLCNEAYSLISRGVVSAKDLGTWHSILKQASESCPLTIVDDCVTNSLGPRWATTGPLMANAMGGGGGAEGFKHLIEHLGPASQAWLEDSKAHTFKWDGLSIEALSTSVEEELKGADVKALEEKRDQQLVRLFKLKKEAQD